MSIVVRYHPANLTNEQYDQMTPAARGSFVAPEGLDHHLCFGSDGNLLVSEIWDSREQWQAFGAQLMPILTDIGIEFSGEPEVFEVHNAIRR